jgi:hypothetical protein
MCEETETMHAHHKITSFSFLHFHLTSFSFLHFHRLS